MTEKIIKENTDYVRVNGSFIINRNANEYAAALSRRKSINRMQNVENRINDLEKKFDHLINLLENIHASTNR